MPALPVVPFVIRVTLKHTAGLDIDVVNRIYLQYTGTAPTNAMLNTFATSVSTQWNASLGGLANPVVKLTEVDVVDLSSATGAVGLDSTVHTGTRTGQINAGGVAALINFHIARRYRGGKPRIYTPYLNAADLTDEQDWNTTQAASLLTGWNAFVTALKALTWAGATITNQVNVSYYTGFASVQNPVTHRWKNISTPRVTPLIDVVVSSSVNPKPASQRRRNRP
jgi:hypothetical protein